MSIDRGNSKHGPRLDEQMAHEAKGDGRVEEWREPEPPGDGQPEAGWTPLGHHGMETGDDRDPDRRELRARIGAYVPREIFPADRERLVKAAQEHHAPDQVVEALSQLPPDVTLPGAPELWDALDLRSDR